MKKFMDEDFMLSGKTASDLYHGFAKKLPITDYRCRLSAKEIAHNVRYSNITELWLYDDRDKQRAMLSAGADEKYVTGDASDYEKFREYCKIMPSLIGNPVYIQGHLELLRFFGCELTVCEKNCDEIWHITSKRLADDDMSARKLIKKSGAVLLCTADDPADSLEYHKMISEDNSFATKVLPSFCPDKVLNIDRSGITDYIRALGVANSVNITDLTSLFAACTASLDRFEVFGCKTACHGTGSHVKYQKPDAYHADLILKKAIVSDGVDITEDELALFRGEMMYFFGKEYAKRGFIMQYKVCKKAADRSTEALFSYLKKSNAMPRTVIHGNHTAVVMPNVYHGILPSYADGMKDEIRSIAENSSLGSICGFASNADAPLSLARHEYFRRVLCDFIGEQVERGLYPYDETELEKLVTNICCNNMINVFGFDPNT